MSFVTDRLPLPVSTIEMVLGVILYVKSACVTGFSTGLKSRLIAWCEDIRATYREYANFRKTSNSVTVCFRESCARSSTYIRVQLPHFGSCIAMSAESGMGFGGTVSIRRSSRLVRRMRGRRLQNCEGLVLSREIDRGRGGGVWHPHSVGWR
jgi:hypothetical protein